MVTILLTPANNLEGGLTNHVALREEPVLLIIVVNFFFKKKKKKGRLGRRQGNSVCWFLA